METDAREHYQLWSAGQRRILQAVEDEYVANAQALANDPIVYFMRSLVCAGCGCPVVSCSCRDEDLPFCHKDEVGE